MGSSDFLDFSFLPFPEQKKSFLIAVSGGADSMCLLAAMVERGLAFTVAHVNYGLRGNDSNSDQELVRNYCKKYNVACYTKSIDLLAYKQTHKGSVQMLAREVRYDWFRKLMQELGCDILLTGHHLQDVLETQFINTSRGSGIKGLTALKPWNGLVYRPLIFKHKNEIYAHNKKYKIPFREDATNTSHKYKRNRLRLEAIPALESMHPTFYENFKKSYIFQLEEAKVIENYISDLRKEWEWLDHVKAIIPIQKILDLNPFNTLLHHLFEPYGFNSITELKKILESKENHTQIQSQTHFLTKFQDSLYLEPLELRPVAEPIELPFCSSIGLKDSFGLVKHFETFYVRKDQLKLPLIIRHPRSTDVFYPIGMEGSKKVSKFLRDEKLNPFERKEVHVLCDQIDTIVWIVNRRLDRRFLINKNNKNALAICYE